MIIYQLDHKMISSSLKEPYGHIFWAHRLSLSVSGAPDRTYCIQITEHMNPLDHHVATAM